jgi:hypothetical protein
MNQTQNTSAATKQHNRETETTNHQAPIQQHQADSHRTKNLDTHLRITIEWGCPPPSYLAATDGGGVADRTAFGRRQGAGGASC